MTLEHQAGQFDSSGSASLHWGLAVVYDGHGSRDTIPWIQHKGKRPQRPRINRCTKHIADPAVSLPVQCHDILIGAIDYCQRISDLPGLQSADVQHPFRYFRRISNGRGDIPRRHGDDPRIGGPGHFCDIIAISHCSLQASRKAICLYLRCDRRILFDSAHLCDVFWRAVIILAGLWKRRRREIYCLSCAYVDHRFWRLLDGSIFTRTDQQTCERISLKISSKFA